MSDPFLPLNVISASVCVGSETDGWNLDQAAAEGDPERVFLVDVFFETPFLAPPVVHLGVTGFDIDQCSSSRLGISTIAISKTGFQAQLRTWRSSRVYSVEFQWMAIGS
ncbi:MAG: H-type lectin domain-containing protein [Verrucomicrobiales bacterium]|nr:H-type lectin domain-containing protein [Verrucomicrobiales bacterium]